MYYLNEFINMENKVGVLGNKVVHVVKEDDPITLAAKEMREHNIGALIVINNDGKVSGIVTERDLVRVVAEGNINAKVKDYMTRNIIGVTEDTDIYDALDTMLEHGFRHLPIVSSKDGRVIGIVSIRDLVRGLLDPHHFQFKKDFSEVKGTGYICPVCGMEIDEYGYCGCGTGSG